MSLHINAKPGDFAKVVLMPGDPVRAKWIADTFLHDVKLVNDVRGILAFTGYTKNNKRISVMASGMGMPSIGIYSYELYSSYDVGAIIRVGTCGSYQDYVDLKDVLICSRAITDSNFMSPELGDCTRVKESDKDLLDTATSEAKKAGIPYHIGDIYSADVFYDVNPNFWKKWANMGALGVEMESYALYITAERTHKKALCLLTATDHFIKKDQKLSSEERAHGLTTMIELAIRVAEKYC